MTMSWEERPLEPLGVEIALKLQWPLPPGFEERTTMLFDRHKLLIFRNQSPTEQDQAKLLKNFGRVLGSRGEYRKTAVNAIQRGMRVGQESDALLLKKLETVFHLPRDEAREALGVRGAEHVDTSREGAFFASDGRILLEPMAEAAE